jgi:hypothetical protein
MFRDIKSKEVSRAKEFPIFAGAISVQRGVRLNTAYLLLRLNNKATCRHTNSIFHLKGQGGNALPLQFSGHGAFAIATLC